MIHYRTCLLKAVVLVLAFSMMYRELITEFAARMGIQGAVVFDNDGVWRFGSEDIVFVFREFPELDAILMYSLIGGLPTAGVEKFKTALLRANFVEQGAPHGAFSLTEDDKIFIHRMLDMKGLDVETLSETFTDFATLALEWKRLASDYAPVAAEEEAKEMNASEFKNYLNTSGFIRV